MTIERQLSTSTRQWLKSCHQTRTEGANGRPRERSTLTDSCVVDTDRVGDGNIAVPLLCDFIVTHNARLWQFGDSDQVEDRGLEPQNNVTH